MSINGNMVGCYSPIGKTFILVDSKGAEITGVIVDQETNFNATAEDIKVGKTAVTDEGVTEGADTRTYRTTHSTRVIFPGESFSIPLAEYNKYDYTKFQAMIAEFNTNQFDSTSVDKFSLNNEVFNVGSDVKIADVTKNSVSKSIDLNITNNTENSFIIHYSTYKEG